MPPRKEPEKASPAPRRRPADTPEDREQQMINYADQLAERQLREGTASSQVIIHYLKLGTSREQADQEKIHLETLRMKAQIAQIESQSTSGELLEKVMSALKVYAGGDDDDDL